MLGISIVGCVLIVALFVWLHGQLGGWSALLYVPIAFMGSMISPAAFLVALLLGVTGVFMPRTARGRTRWLAGGTAIGIVFCFVWRNTQNEIDELRELRAKYPIESLTDRLAYEVDSSRFVSPSGSAATGHFAESATATHNDVDDAFAELPGQLTLSDTVVGNLKEFESDTKRAGKSYLFRQLHSASYERFIRANGFGVVRMRRVNRRWIEHELSDLDPVLQITPASEYPELVESPADLGHDEISTEPMPLPDAETARSGLSQLHYAGRSEFLDADRFGFIESQQRAAGFQPHAFRQAVHPRVPEFLQSLQVARLELVSLLKFPTPRVYVSEYLPDMEQLQGVATRELDGFESAALKKLWTEEDIVVEEHGGELRMLGSLRAGTHCLKCHSVQRGDLLGAFSYRIRIPGQRPPRLLPEDRQTALRLDTQPHSLVALARADRY
ncbi:MAG: hypothetical protein ACYTGL_22320 [Planctomycetota bacterium]|jgi:hypothetical protein